MQINFHIFRQGCIYSSIPKRRKAHNTSRNSSFRYLFCKNCNFYSWRSCHRIYRISKSFCGIWHMIWYHSHQVQSCWQRIMDKSPMVNILSNINKLHPLSWPYHNSCTGSNWYWHHSSCGPSNQNHICDNKVHSFLLLPRPQQSQNLNPEQVFREVMPVPWEF